MNDSVKSVKKLLLLNLSMLVLLLILLVGFATNRIAMTNASSQRILALELQAQSQNAILATGVRNSAENLKILERIQDTLEMRVKDNPKR